MVSIEFEAAVIQLEALGFLKVTEDEYIGLTDKGIERAKQILQKLPIDDRVLLALLGGDMAKSCASYEDPEDK